MDIAGLSSAMSQKNLTQEVNASVNKLAMDQVENSAEQFNDLLESSTVDRSELENSVQDHLGSNFDQFV